MWTKWEQGEHQMNDPLKVSTLHGAEKIRNELKKLLGTDLTIHTRSNPFWKGEPNTNFWCPTNFKQRRPWMWVERVALGRSAGLMMAHGTPWQMKFRTFIATHLYPY